jgi:outer membrane protein W
MCNKLEKQPSCNRTQYLLQSFHVVDETLPANILATKLYAIISHLKELGVMAGVMGNIQKTIQVTTSLTLYWHIQPANNNHINLI